MIILEVNPYLAFQQRILDLYVEHLEVKRIWKRLDKNRWIKRNSEETDETPIHLFIEGKPGAGKTLCVKKYARQNSGNMYVDDDGTEYDLKPVVYMKMPIPFTQKELYNNILRGVGVPVNSRNRDIGTIKDQAFSLLKKLRTEMLIIDEFDYALTSPDNTQRIIMENIKDISNSADICLVCVGTSAIENLRMLNSQHIRRYPKTVLSHFEHCDGEFVAFLKEIEDKLVSPVSLNLSDPDSSFALLLHELTGGLVGWIKPILREAFDLIGVFNDDFNDFSILNRLNGDILGQAQINIIGEYADADVGKILSDNLSSLAP